MEDQQSQKRTDVARRDAVMGWRRFVIDAIVVSLLLCAVASFVTAIYAWVVDRGPWSVFGWVFMSLIMFGLTFLGWCIQEVGAEEAMARADEDAAP